MKLSQIEVDVEAEENGAWRPHPYFRGVEVMVRSTHSNPYKKKQREMADAFPTGKRLSRSQIAKQAEYVHRYSLPTLLLGFRGIDDAEYSPELADRWVNDDGLYRKTRRFWEGVFELADDVGEREQEQQQATQGN